MASKTLPGKPLAPLKGGVGFRKMTPVRGRSVGVGCCGRDVLHAARFNREANGVWDPLVREIQLFTQVGGGRAANTKYKYKKDFLILFRISVKISVRRLESFSYQ